MNESDILRTIREYVIEVTEAVAPEIMKRQLTEQVEEAVRHHMFPERLGTSTAVEYSGLTRRQLQRAVERGDIHCIPGGKGRGRETTYFRDELREYRARATVSTTEAA